MTGFESKRQAAQNKMNDDADTLSIVYQRGFADGKRAAQPEQEPVAWMVKLGDVTCFQHHADSKHASVPLYTTPPAAQRKPLTDDQLDEIAVIARRGNLHDLRIAIEAAHNLKEQP
jgi:hypothetical protein